METKVSYAIVGGFVVFLSAAIVGGVLWLGSGRGYRKDYQTYLAYFGESVSGLNLHAPVKYRGVEVGSVRRIGLDPANPELVQLTLDVERGAPVKEDTVAMLSVQGLTGIAFVELGGGSKGSPRLGPPPGGGPPVIRTVPSLFKRLDASASALLVDLDRTSQRVNAILDERTRLAFQRSVRDLERVMHSLAARSADVEAAVAAAARTLEGTSRASAQLAGVVERVGRAADAVQGMASELGQAGASARASLEGVREAVEAAGGGVRQFGAESLPELERLVAQARDLTASLGRVSQQLERDPSVLLLGRRPAPPGPGE